MTCASNTPLSRSFAHVSYLRLAFLVAYFIRPLGIDASTHIFRVFAQLLHTNYVYDCARVRVILLNRNTSTMLVWDHALISAGVHSIDIFSSLSPSHNRSTKSEQVLPMRHADLAMQRATQWALSVSTQLSRAGRNDSVQLRPQSRVDPTSRDDRSVVAGASGFNNCSLWYNQGESAYRLSPIAHRPSPIAHRLASWM